MNVTDTQLAFTVPKNKIAENGEYNLTGDRYRETVDYRNVKWPMVTLGEVCEVSSGNTAPQDKNLFFNGKYPFYRTFDVGKVHLSDNLIEVRDRLNDNGIKNLKIFKKGTILFPKSGASTFLNHRVIMGLDGYVSSHLATITKKDNLVDEKYIYYLLTQIDAKNIAPDQAYPSLKISEISKIQIPLPPLAVQKQIVAEIEQWQKVIDGAKQVAENWKPSFGIDPSWERVALGEILFRKSNDIDPQKKEGSVKYIGLENIESNTGVLVGEVNTEYQNIKSTKTIFESDQILYGKLRPNLNKVFYSEFSGICSTDIFVLQGEKNLISHKFYSYYLRKKTSMMKY